MLIEWESDRFIEQLAAAAHGGPAGEAALLTAWATGRSAMVVAALGEATGPDGVRFLRRLVADRTAEGEHRCAGLVALAKRSGTHASAQLADALYDADDAVREFALIALSCVGDGRAVDHVQALLALDLTDPARFRPPHAMQSMAIPMATYLLRHARTRDREDQLARLIRDNAVRLAKAERDWLTVFWPDAISDQPSGIRPDAARMAAWQPLLTARYPR